MDISGSMPRQIKRGSCTTLPDGRRHHIVPAEEDPERFWQLDNLIPLSRSSHDEVHTRYRVSDEEKRKAQEELRELIRVPEWADHPGGYRKV